MKTTSTRRRFAGGTLVLGAALVALGLTGPSASANHVEPDYGGNPSCADLGFDYEFKIDNINDLPAEGDYDADTPNTVEVAPDGEDFPAEFTITLDNVEVVGGHAEFDWEVTEGDVLIQAVLVKSSNGGNRYNYGAGAASDTDLQSPKDSISHLSFCWGGEVPQVEETTTTTEATTTTALTPTTETEVEATDSDVEGEVITAPEQLPRTGDNDSTLFLIGMGLITIGAVSMIARRELFIRS